MKLGRNKQDTQSYLEVLFEAKIWSLILTHNIIINSLMWYSTNYLGRTKEIRMWYDPHIPFSTHTMSHLISTL